MILHYNKKSDIIKGFRKQNIRISKNKLAQLTKNDGKAQHRPIQYI